MRTDMNTHVLQKSSSLTKTIEGTLSKDSCAQTADTQVNNLKDAISLRHSHARENTAPQLSFRELYETNSAKTEAAEKKNNSGHKNIMETVSATIYFDNLLPLRRLTAPIQHK